MKKIDAQLALNDRHFYKVKLNINILSYLKTAIVIFETTIEIQSNVL